MNRRIRKHCLIPSCTLIVGDRGAGKSTVFAMIAREAIKEGLEVYCQFPYTGVHMIPTVPIRYKGVTKYQIDKDWLYTADLAGSVVLIDEARTVWPARDWGKWSQSDDEFFNYLRKYNVHVYAATQSYDAVDLNVKRASDETWYLTKGWFHLTHIEASQTTIAKVADKQTEVIGRNYKAGMAKVNWEICEMPVGHFRFWRRPYYNDFITDYAPDNKVKLPQPYWDDFIDFKSKSLKTEQVSQEEENSQEPV